MKPSVMSSAAVIACQARRALAIVGVAAMAACGSDADPAGPPANGSIRGSVLDDAGAAVANAAVTMTGNGQTDRTTSSGANGAYLFEDVPPGAYELSIAAPAGFTAGAASTASITVGSGTEARASFVLNRPPDSVFTASLRGWLQAATAAEQFSGAVRVTRDGRTLFEGAYGSADRERNIPNTLNTQFRVASMYKMLTGVAVLQLVQAGKLNLDAPFGTYIPDYPNAEMASTVTIHHLLTHTGGTGDVFGPTFMANRLQLRSVDDYLRLFGTRGLLFAPGSKWEYSNYGFVLLGAVIERVTGMSYDSYIEANVLGPAAMTATGTAPEDSVMPDRSVGYMRMNATAPLISNAGTLPYRGSPAGGGYSTVTDFLRFAAAVREHRLLDAQHTALMTSGKVQGPIFNYAYGFLDRVLTGRRFVGHNGTAAGMNGELWFEPNGGYEIVILSNFSPPAAGLLLNYIVSQLPK